mgnify:CR=1 FL=1
MIISGGIFEKNNIISKLANIEIETKKKSFWNDNNNVKNVLKQKKFYDQIITSYENLSHEIKDLDENIVEEIRSGEVVGILTVIVCENSELRHEAAGLFHDGYAMAGRLDALKNEMLYMEAGEDYEVLLDDEE